MSDEEEVSEEVAPKFEEAEDAGTKNGHLCTLILADGWTAAEVAVAGLSVVGRKQYGMYRLFNFSRETVHLNVADITEINDLMKIVGLDYNVDYSSEVHRKRLRYGKLMMLTDQDERGSCFKGRFINFIYSNWPYLLHLSPSFLEEIITPVVKATQGEDKFSFYSLAEFEKWKEHRPNIDAYTVKHFRGLGTNTSIELKEYFSNMDFHRVAFKYSGPECDKNLTKAFHKDALEQRRQWLTRHMEECKQRKFHGFQDSLLYTAQTKQITFSEFINLEYVFFAGYDNVHSIPSVVDGLKPGQRKVLFTCFKRDFKSNVRVSQLASCTAEETAYYESELAICKYIYDMAQTYVGSANINLLIPVGQFGTRLLGGEDHADQHSLRTCMSTVARRIFHPHDDPLLSYTFDESTKTEPKWYVPVIPMLLVNGSEGTGTGWSTNVPKHDPHQLIRCLRNMLSGKIHEVLLPFYRHFRGTIHAVSNSRFISIGCLAIIEGDKIEITELPIGTWTTPYKENVLERLLHGTKTMRPIITDYKEYQTDETVRFVITFAPGEFEKLQNEVNGFHRMFQLYGVIKTDTMYAFDSCNTLRKYELADDILQEFYDLRLKYYVKRKEYLVRKLTAEADKLRNQVRFIVELNKNTIVFEDKPLKLIVDELFKLGYDADPLQKWKDENGIETPAVDVREEFQHLPINEKSDAIKLNYLLNMPIRSLTEEMKNQLISELDEKMSELLDLISKSPYDLWMTDLDELESELNRLEEKERINLSKCVVNKDLHPSEVGRKVELKSSDELFEEILSMGQ